MIQNELLPGCAVLYNGKGCIYSKQFHTIQGYFRPIPLTAESVAKVEGFLLEDYWGGGCYHFTFCWGWVDYSIVTNKIYFEGVRICHINSIHQLQILIYSLTGTMPKYEIG